MDILHVKSHTSLPMQRDTEHQTVLWKSPFQLFLGQGTQPRTQPPQLYV